MGAMVPASIFCSRKKQEIKLDPRPLLQSMRLTISTLLSALRVGMLIGVNQILYQSKGHTQVQPHSVANMFFLFQVFSYIVFIIYYRRVSRAYWSLVFNLLFNTLFTSMKFTLMLTAKILYLFCSVVLIHDFNVTLLRDSVILSSPLAITISGYRARVIPSGSTNLQ